MEVDITGIILVSIAVLLSVTVMVVGQTTRDPACVNRTYLLGHYYRLSGVLMRSEENT